MAESFAIPIFDKYSIPSTFMFNAKEIYKVYAASIAANSSFTINIANSYSYAILHIISLQMEGEYLAAIPTPFMVGHTNLSLFNYLSGSDATTALPITLTASSSQVKLNTSSRAYGLSHVNGFIYIIE